MGLYIRNDEKRSQINSKVMSDLNYRLHDRAKDINDSSKAVLLKNHKKTTTGGLFWASIIAIVLLAAASYLIFIF
ncbi:MAG: hypothetical protein PVI21_05800 [Candidatus Woesebacteria bacterium]